jgi:hypothetical protein
VAMPLPWETNLLVLTREHLLQTNDGRSCG